MTIPARIEVLYNGNSFFIEIADGKMVSLSRIFEISGSPSNQCPEHWAGLSSTKTILDSLEEPHPSILKDGGGSTWAHWQLALAYAQYLSSELYLAVNQVFKERLEEMIDPELGLARSKERARKAWKAKGKTDEWIAKREQGKLIRDNYVHTLINHDVKPGAEVGHCTNQIYKGLFFKDSVELEGNLRKNNPNLPKKINIRDHAKLSSLAAISLAEALSSEKIEEINAKGVEPCAKVSLDKATSVRIALDDSRSKDKASLPPIENKRYRNKEKNRTRIQELRDAITAK